MDPERWQRIKAAFSAALELPPEQRANWLSMTLPDDPGLAAEVRKLLAAYVTQDSIDDFYEQGALAAIPDLLHQLDETIEGMRLGPYRVLSELGRGGMGAVYLAVRDEGSFTQKVALKLVKRGMDTDEIVRRFVAERQILASLAHPNIARLFDGGSAPDGRPYFVMEYVEGRPITAYVKEHELSVEARLHLFLRVCRAVQHAHQSLVVHRDLKPVNILVDAEGEPKLLDFGIAKLLDPSSFGRMTTLTLVTPGPMTPEYASPEQREGGPITTATDVYGLGLLLYELLAGQSPRSVERDLGEGWSARPPSQAIAALAAEGDAEKKRLARRVAGDLDTIIGKALEIDPKRRYGTAAALAEDVERHLTQRPVEARRPTLAYRLSRTVARHKLAAALILAVCLLAALSTYQAFVARKALERAEMQRQRAEALLLFLQSLIQKANPKQSRGETLTVRQVFDAGAEKLLGRDSRYQPETWAALLQTMGTIYQDLGLYEQARKNLERALQLRESLNISPDLDSDLALAGILTDLGDVSYKQLDYPASRRFFERALALKEGRLGPTALPLAEDLNGLGALLTDQGHLDEAERRFARACEISRLAQENGSKDLADCYLNLGALAARREELARARVFFSAAFNYYRSRYGEDDPGTVAVRDSLAYLVLETGDPAGAETMYQEIADVYRRLYEPNHPDLARALVQVAAAQQRGGRLTEARATLNELMQMRREHRFPHDQSEAEIWNSLAAVTRDLGDLEGAEAAYIKSYEIYRALPGERRAELSNVLNGQARIRLLRNNPAGALALAQHSRELARASEIRPGDSLARAERILGLSYLALGQPSRARPSLEKSHQILLELYGPDHPDTREAADVLRRLDAPAG